MQNRSGGMTKFLQKKMVFAMPVLRQARKPMNCDHAGYGEILRGDGWHCIRCGASMPKPKK